MVHRVRRGTGLERFTQGTMLRPVGGGREWEADPARIRPATQEERLSAEVRATNARARGGAMTAPDLEEFGRPPVPVVGCAECESLAVRRAQARAEFDGSAATDANVLLRRHQRREHQDTSDGRRIFRFVPYSIVQDASVLPEYEASCVSGDEADCGAASGPCGHPTEVEGWRRRHTQETRHTRYRRSFLDYAVLERQPV